MQRYPENLLSKLLHRQTFAAPPGAQVNRVRRWYDVLTPSRVIKQVQLPDVHFARFTPSGLYFVAFGPLQHELLLYRYKGLQFSSHGDGGSSRSNASATRDTVDPSSEEAAAGGAASAEHSAVLDGTRNPLPGQQDTLTNSRPAAGQPATGSDEAVGSAETAAADEPERGASEELPPCAAQFDSHFQLLWRKQLVQHPKMLCKDSFLCMHDERFLVVAAQSIPRGHRPTGHGPTTVPLCDSTSIYLVRTADGHVTDSVSMEDDFVPLSHNSGFSSCDDRLAILGLRSQTIKVLQVLPDGRFVALADLGKHLALDDDLAIGQAAAAEQRWQARHPHEAKQIDSRAAALKEPASQESGHLAMPPATHHGAMPTMQRAASGLLGGGVRGGRWGPPAPATPPATLNHSSSLTGAASLGQLLHAPNALVDRHPDGQPQPQQQPRAASSGSTEPGGTLITGLRHRLLAYLWRALRDPAAAAVLLDCSDVDVVMGEDLPFVPPELSSQGCLRKPQGERTPQQATGGRVGTPQWDYFLAHYESLASLVVWKMQLLSAEYLMVAVGPPEGGSPVRSLELQHKATFMAVYSLSQSVIVAMFPYTNTAALELWLSRALWFHSGAVTAPWHRFLTPNGHPASARVALQRQLAQQFFTPSQVTRRALSAVPPNCGLLTSSPYLDAHMFRYDDKLINPTTRPRAVTEQTLKFMWRGAREVLRFKVAHSWELQEGGPRAPKQQVTWHFHPVVPFVLGLLQTQGRPTQAAIYHHPV